MWSLAEGLPSKRELPRFVRQRQACAADETAQFDKLMERKLQQLPPSKLKDIALVVGIPFYTEISNIVSVRRAHVSLRTVFLTSPPLS